MERTEAANPGDVVKRLRDGKGYSQAGTCRRAGVSLSTLYRAEVAGVVSRRTAERLAPVLGVRVADLIGGER